MLTDDCMQVSLQQGHIAALQAENTKLKREKTALQQDFDEYRHTAERRAERQDAVSAAERAAGRLAHNDDDGKRNDEGGAAPSVCLGAVSGAAPLVGLGATRDAATLQHGPLQALLLPLPSRAEPDSPAPSSQPSSAHSQSHSGSCASPSASPLARRVERWAGSPSRSSVPELTHEQLQLELSKASASDGH